MKLNKQINFVTAVIVNNGWCPKHNECFKTKNFSTCPCSVFCEEFSYFPDNFKSKLFEERKEWCRDKLVTLKMMQYNKGIDVHGIKSNNQRKLSSKLEILA